MSLADSFTTELLASLLADIGVKVALPVLKSIGSSPQPSQAAARTIEERNDLDLDPLLSMSPGQDFSESPLFLAHQRFRHRVQLAREKWEWLILSTYFHPIIGRSGSLPAHWHPRIIAGQFTTCDFASGELPHEKDIGETSPSDIRVALLHTRIQIVGRLAQLIERLDTELQLRASTLNFPKPPWDLPQIKHAWISFLLEIWEKRFPEDSNLKSFCGFKRLTSVEDTPAAGIRSREFGSGNPVAYASIMEIAWHSIQSDAELGSAYTLFLKRKQPYPHQYALRRVAVRVLEKIWDLHSLHLKGDAPQRQAQPHRRNRNQSESEPRGTPTTHY